MSYFSAVLFSRRSLFSLSFFLCMECAAQWLSGKIRSIRTSRTRESKLKITEAEKRYKERAVKGIVFDAAEMIERERKSQVPETAKRGSTFHTEEKGEGK